MVWIAILCFLVIVGPFTYLTIRYNNPYKLYFLFGRKGAGKTTYLTKLAYEYNRKGIPVYCNTEIPGTYLIDAKDIGFYGFPEDSVILIDEVSLIWDNRNFKSFKPEVGKFFRLQRHHKLTVYLCSQTFDVDLKIRNLCDRMYLMQCWFGWLTYIKEVKRTLTVVNPSADSESRIADKLEIPPWWLFFFGTRKWIFIPKWSRYFDSHLIEDPLPMKEYVFQPYKDGQAPRQHRRFSLITGLYRAVARRRSDNNEETKIAAP